MKEYDVVVVGGAIAGPVAAKFTAKSGLKTLLIEREAVPRHKSCSGIQFPYFEKILDEKIPQNILCNNTLDKVEMIYPDGKKMGNGFPMLNFMRNVFDEWLCKLAVSYGAEFRDSCKLADFRKTGDSIEVDLKSGAEVETIKTKYLIDASGMRPVIRRKLRPNKGYEKGSTGATLNYYFSADGDLEKDKLYQVWNLDYNNRMFAWVYNKTLDDKKDYWVVGTGYDTGIQERQDRFFEYIKERFNLTNIEIVYKEGYSSSMSFTDTDKVWLGEDNFMMIGDAAGLIDLTRGVGMDAAALSGRLAAKAIVLAEKTGKPVMPIYEKVMRSLVRQTAKNQSRGILAYKDNSELQKHLNMSLLKMVIKLLVFSFLNKRRSGEKQLMIP